MITACPGLQCGWLPWMVLLSKPTKLFKRLCFQSENSSIRLMQFILAGSTHYTVASLHKSYSATVTLLLTHDCESFEKSLVCIILWNSKLVAILILLFTVPCQEFFFAELHNMAIKRNAGILVLDHLQKQTFPLYNNWVCHYWCTNKDL